jgi:predicted lipid-binding transport protein (Tim44 family)
VSYPNADPAQDRSRATNSARSAAMPADRRRQAWGGGMLAGIAIALGLAVVMHVIQQVSPNSVYSIRDSVLLVVLIGLVIGLGLAIGFSAAVPDGIADPAEPSRAMPADQPSAPSA